MIGSWIGERICITGDDYGKNFQTISDTYTNIAQQVFELIAQLSPYDLVHYGGIEWFLRVVEHKGKYVTITPGI